MLIRYHALCVDFVGCTQIASIEKIAIRGPSLLGRHGFMLQSDTSPESTHPHPNFDELRSLRNVCLFQL